MKPSSELLPALAMLRSVYSDGKVANAEAMGDLDENNLQIIYKVVPPQL